MSVVTPREGYKLVKWLFGKKIEIPQEWEVKTFDDLFEFIISGTNARSDLNNSGEIGYIHYGDIHTKWNLQLDCDLDTIPRIDKEKVSKLQLLKEGDLIIADASEDVEGSGTSISLKNVKNKKIVAGLHTLVLRRKNENISFNFMKYLTSISSVKIQIISWVTGAKVFGLTKANSKKIKVPLPTFPEQQKIGTMISNVDNLIESTEKVITHSKKVKKGLIQKLLTRGLGHTKFKKVPWYFGKEIEIPEEWKITTLKKNSYVTDGSHLSPPKVPKGFPMATVENVRDSSLDIDSCYKISKEDFKQLIKNNCKPEINDVLFTKDGTVGKSLVFTQDVDVVILSSIAILKPFESLDSYFLHYSFHSEATTKFIAKFLGGTAIKRIVLKNLEKFYFPLPPLKEQQKIASILLNIDSKITSQEQYREKLLFLKKSLMEKLLTGEVRVKV